MTASLIVGLFLSCLLFRADPAEGRRGNSKKGTSHGGTLQHRPQKGIAGDDCKTDDDCRDGFVCADEFCEEVVYVCIHNSDCPDEDAVCVEGTCLKVQ